MRRKLRKTNEMIGGKVVHPVLGLPGGVSRPISEEEAEKIKKLADEAAGFAEFTLKIFKDIVLSNKEHVNLITSEAYTHRTYYMGFVDESNHVNFYYGLSRVVSPSGGEFRKFDVHDYLNRGELTRTFERGNEE